MTDNLPDYTTVEPPDDKPIEEYTTHERRAALLRRIQEAGSPFAITQAREADRFDVHESTISRDMDRLREAIDSQLGNDAKLTTRILYEEIVSDLLQEDDWKAKKAAWDVAMDWNEWLAEIGEQHREPDRSEVDVEMEARTTELSYTVVRGGDPEDLPSDDEGEVDYDELGFTKAPTTIDVEDTETGGD